MLFNQDIEERSVAILRKARELFVKNVTDLGSGDISGKARLIRFMERTLDRREGAAAAAVPVSGTINEGEL